MAELVIALDVTNTHDALQAVSSIAPLPVWYKVGLELFTAEGPAVVRSILSQGHNVFLDMKYYDIPNTVKGACRSACNLGVQMLTVHVAGGEEMASAALQGRELAHHTTAATPIILGITLLTSDGSHKDRAGEIAVARALQAKQFGLDGVVCSGLEAAQVKQACGNDFICLCPGIRFANSQTHNDQARVCTPNQATRNGADFLVMGRPILTANNPNSAAQEALNLRATADKA